jgi:hypothetical protein
VYVCKESKLITMTKVEFIEGLKTLNSGELVRFVEIAFTHMTRVQLEDVLSIADGKLEELDKSGLDYDPDESIEWNYLNR